MRCGLFTSWILGPALLAVIAFLLLLPFVCSIVDGSRGEGRERGRGGVSGRVLLGYQYVGFLFTLQ